MASQKQGIVFPRDIAGKLHRHLGSTGTWQLIREQKKNDPKNARRNLPDAKLVRPLPTREHVRAILDAAYVASLLEEEGRKINFTLGYLSEKGALRQQHKVMPFKTPLPLLPGRLAKFALAAEPLTTTFGVWPGKKGPLQVWGLVHHGNHTFDVDLTFLPTYLSVRVLRPGSFTAHFDGRPVLLFSRDHYALFDKRMDKRIDLVDILRDWVKLDVPVAVALQRLCRRMIDLGHGGTILLTERGVTPSALKMHGSLTMREGGLTLLKDVVEEDRKRGTGEGAPKPPLREGTAVHQGYRLDERHREALTFVAQLTAVDGAVVLDNELNIHGFGATISTQGRTPSVTIEDPKELGKIKPLDLETRGNRHRSAIHFCAQQTGLALAFVASQDGDFSLAIRKADGGVHVVGPYELGVGI